MGILKTALYEVHRELGAVLTEFAGWEMPLRYGRLGEEVMSVRERVGCFDVSHMGRLVLSGERVVEFLNYVSSNQMDVREGRTRYTLVLNERGGIKDDDVAMRIGEKEFLMVVNAASREKILNWVKKINEEGEFRVDIQDVTFKTVMVAVQGPEARQLVHRVVGQEFTMRKFRVRKTEVLGSEAVVSRTGYTGEDGYEIIVFDTSAGIELFRRLVEAGATPCGLEARDVLRLEAGLPLYGADMDEDTDPFEARLDFAVKMDKGDFIGREALLERSKSVKRVRVGLMSRGRRVPRRGARVLWRGKEVGVVTSGAYSPTVGRGIGMAYLSPDVPEGTEVTVEVRGRPIEAEVRGFPFYDEKVYGWRRVRPS